MYRSDTPIRLRTTFRSTSSTDISNKTRKLAMDFYGGNSKIGGGSPWTKDASKADLTLHYLPYQKWWFKMQDHFLIRKYK